MQTQIVSVITAAFMLGAASGALPLLLADQEGADAADSPAAADADALDPARTADLDPAPAAAPRGADEERVEKGTAGDPADEPGRAPGMDRPTFPPSEGQVPTSGQAGLERVTSLVIRGDDALVPANGVRSGNGTLDDPYIITGFQVSRDLFIADTSKCIVVKENYIGGQLTLNWNGQCVHAHHNYVRDLRVNENVKRTGYATGGLLELNKIQFIGQLRHYDGEFRDNIVGPFDSDSIFDPIFETVPWMFVTDPRVANVDGFNQGIIHHNTFYGSVDLDLHGHHHGTGFFAPHSHYHGANEAIRHEEAHDHTMRWTSVAFTDNHIIAVADDDYGLRYEDRNHAGDDRTATSETEETLREEHRHFTHIVLARNTIEKGQLWVDVFNADDKLHHGVNPGWLEVTDNEVHFQARNHEGSLGLPFFGPGTNWNSAIHVVTAKEVELLVRGNHVTFTPAPPPEGIAGTGITVFAPTPPKYAGIDLDQMRNATISIDGNTVVGFDHGVRASHFKDTAWHLADNEFRDVGQPVWYDDSVPRPGS